MENDNIESTLFCGNHNKWYHRVEIFEKKV